MQQTKNYNIKHNQKNLKIQYKKIIKDNNLFESNKQVSTNNQNLADFIGISTSFQFKASLASSPVGEIISSPSFICVSHLTVIFPWIMLNHRKEFRRIGGFTAPSYNVADILQFNMIGTILKKFYNFQFFFIYFYFNLIMLILNCNFNLVLWKNAENIMQINDS